MKQVFLAGTHSDGLPLPQLVDEIRIIEDAFWPLQLREVFEVNVRQVANLDDIFKTFNRHGSDIAVFHYAGHANQKELLIEGGGKVGGLAALLELTNQRALHLVFLNGCATAGLVESFHQAGCRAVIATNREVNDDIARNFAAQFYKTWTIEAKTLKQAFDMAKAYLQSKVDQSDLPSIEIVRGFGRLNSEQRDKPIPWGLYLNPGLSQEEEERALNWLINPSLELPPQVLEKVETVTSESLRKVAYEFCKMDAEARKEAEKDNHSELMELIIRMPWTVGTHLRRLFAVDKDRTMTHGGIKRLKEIAKGYTELTRFICYIALSALWEDTLNQQQHLKLSLSELLVSSDSRGRPRDYIFYLKQYHQMLGDMPGDIIKLEAKIGGFLDEVKGRLHTAYQFMERLKDALAQGDDSAELNNFIANYGPEDGVDGVCRKAEATYGQFIKAAFFLTEYTLYSVRAISVEKVRYLNLEAPYVHKTIKLHAATCRTILNTDSSNRKIAGDNYSILLAPRAGEDADLLENALNLSPFYIDKHALIGEKRDNYPAIFVLDGQKNVNSKEEIATEKVYSYEYLDFDINHKYLAPDDHQLGIVESGLWSKTKNVQLKEDDEKRFREIYQQIEKLSQDFQSVL